MPDYDTRPTIETLLEEMKKGFAAMAEQFNEVFHRLDLIERRQARQDEKIDLFIAEVLELKRQMRHPV